MAAEKREKYLGPDGWKKAQADLDEFRIEGEKYLKDKGITHRQTILSSPTTPIQVLLGVSYDLIKHASSEKDAEMIRRLAVLSRKVLLGGNAMNFSSLKEHGYIAGIERETRAFVTGYDLGNNLATKHVIDTIHR